MTKNNEFEMPHDIRDFCRKVEALRPLGPSLCSKDEFRAYSRNPGFVSAPTIGIETAFGMYPLRAKFALTRKMPDYPNGLIVVTIP